MGGYGGFVWGSYAVAAICIAMRYYHAPAPLPILSESLESEPIPD